MSNDQPVEKPRIDILGFGLVFAVVICFSSMCSYAFAYCFWSNIFGYSTDVAFLVFVTYTLWLTASFILMSNLTSIIENTRLNKIIDVTINWMWILFFVSIFICMFLNFIETFSWKSHTSYPQLVGTWSSVNGHSDGDGLFKTTKNQPIIKDIFKDETYFAEGKDTSVVQQLMYSDGISIKWDDSSSAYANNVYLMQLTIKKSIFGRNIIASSEDQPFKNLPLKVQIYVITKLKQSETHENVLRDLAKDFPVANCMSKPNATANKCM